MIYKSGGNLMKSRIQMIKNHLLNSEKAPGQDLEIKGPEDTGD